jgi:hypothetical protein
VKKKIIQLEDIKKHAYALVIGQCSPDLNSKLKGSAAFVQAEADQVVVQLLLVIRGYCCRFDDHQQRMWALEQAKHRVSTYYQAHDVTNTEYVEHFKAWVGIVKMYRGTSWILQSTASCCLGCTVRSTMNRCPQTAW